ncbi:S8 family serine peptidase [Streptomyces sp. NPDC002911]
MTLRHGARTSLAAAAALSLALTACPAVAAGAAPEPPAGGLTLPVIPSRLNGTTCTDASKRVAEPVPWAQSRLSMNRVWQLSRGRDVVVGVVDTGVAPRTDVFAQPVTAGPSAGRDCVGHGTFVASVIAASPRSGSGFSGIAPEARIHAERGTDEGGTPTAQRVARGIRAAVDGKASVIHVSAALEQSSEELTAALEYARKNDVIVVAPAVPDSPPDSPGGGAPRPRAYWPAAGEGVIAVVPQDITGGRPDGTAVPIKASLSAPGHGVTGAGPVGKGHFVGGGASVAAAFVSATAALIRAYDPALSAAEVARRLVRTGYPAQPPGLDPYGALTSTTTTAKDTGVRAGASHAVSLPHRTDTGGPLRRAVALAGAGVVTVLALWGVSALLRRRRGGPPQEA